MPRSTPAPGTCEEAILEANGGEQVDAVLHMSGGDAFDAELAALAPMGRMVVFGIASREQREVSTAALLRGSKVGDRVLARSICSPAAIWSRR